jgi:hypothetical protein
VICNAVMRANTDIFQWQYYTHSLVRMKSTGTSTTLLGSVEPEELSVAQSTNHASGNMAADNRSLARPITAFSAGLTLPGTGDSDYDPDGYRFRWIWEPDDTTEATCQEATNRNGGARDCTVKALISAKVFKL